MLALSFSGAVTLALLTSTQDQPTHFLLKHKKLIAFLTITLITTFAASYLMSKDCIGIDERFSRAAEAIRHLPLFPQSTTDISFSYQEACTNKTVTFISTEGDSLHNIFLDYSLQAGLITGISLFTCTAFLSGRVFSKYFKSITNKAQGNIGSIFEMSAAVSMVGTSWILWLFQPVSSSNFSMFLCSLYFLALCSSEVLANPDQESQSPLKH